MTTPLTIQEINPDNVIKPYPGRQTKFLELYSVKKILYAGQKNGGKTYMAFLDYLRDIEHSDACGIFLRQTFPALEDAIAKSRNIFELYNGEYSGQKHCWTFPSGARFYMRCLDSEADLRTVTGQEYTAVYIDEAGFVNMEWIELVWSCCRTKNPLINNRLRLFTNPQGVSAPELWDEYIYSHDEGEIKNWRRSSEDDSWYEVQEGEKGDSKTWLFSKRDENLSGQGSYDDQLGNLSRRMRLAYQSGELVLDDTPDQLISFSDLDACLNLPKTPESNYWIVSLDAAGQGSDKSVVTFGRRDQVISIDCYEKKTVPELTRIMEVFLDKYKSQILVLIDAIGYGVGVYENLKDMKKYEGWKSHIIGIGSANANLSQFMEQNKFSSKLLFKEYKDWIAWQMKVMFENREINLSRIKESPYLKKIKREFGAVKWSDDSGKVKISSKRELRRAKNLGGSPDFFDSLSLYCLGIKFYSKKMLGSASDVRKLLESYGVKFGDVIKPKSKSDSKPNSDNPSWV